MYVALFALIAALAADDQSPGVKLTGVVLDASSQPIVGALVTPATAQPKVGPAIFCPSCYLDCAKSTTTDAAGQFEIDIRDPSLKFQVLSSAPGKKTQITKLYDPAAGPLKLTLADIPADLPPERIVRGQLLDDQGHPIAGALIEPSGAKTDNRRWWGRVEADPTVSDKDGNFLLIAPDGYEGLDLSINRKGFAGIDVELVSPGKEPRQITVPSGTQVTGRLVHNGQPLAGQTVAVVQLDRSVPHHFLKAIAAETDADGKFTFNYLPADERYAIFTPVAVGPAPLVLSTKKFTASGNHKSRELGPLEVAAPLRIAGQVDLPVGQSLPPHSKLSLGRDPAWDLISTEIADDGRFEITGLPPETYDIRVTAGNFEIDPQRLTYQATGAAQFGISLKSSDENLRIPLRPPRD
jgi:hypothetical protein